MYSKIAYIYNTFLWQEFSQDLFRRLEIFLYKWKISSHLDIACGTGDFVYLTRKIGIDSYGLDVSKEMILKARKNYPGIKFGVSDMRDFKLKRKIDLITCNFDSINHLLKFFEWEKTFQNVFDNLLIGGKFLFDINTLYAINNFDKKFNVKMGEDIMEMKTSPRGKDILVFDVKSKSGNKPESETIHEVVKETSFEYLKIKKSLLKIGFTNVRIFNKELGINSSKIRKYILAIK